jgi:ABC-type phosphate transport system substrate-binding protein
VLLLAGLLLAPARVRAEERRYQVIVNAQNPVESMSRTDVAKLFLDRSARWPEGGTAAPVDLSLTSAVRAAFSRDVLGFTLPAVKNYWDKRMMANHEMPPPVRSNDAEIIAYVAKNKAGIGYVSGAAPLEPAVKVLKLLD